ncbi:FtsX-like permease family protein [Pedobacter sp.]|uniref:ABC transporter permease n=1 Tax=Pedobacter sp. TaxID=1411316 RepID=UPI00396C4E2E
MFKLNLKIALRNLWKNKSYTMINVGGLAIGLASCTLLLLYVAYEWSFDKHSPNSDKTYVVYNNFKTNSETFSWAWTPGVMAKEVEETIAGVKIASHSSYPEKQLISYGQQQFKKQAVFADKAFLKIMDYHFLKGDPNQALAGVNAVILTESLAKNLFGNEDPVNKSVKLNNEEVLKVTGIIADVPLNSSIRFDYLLTWDMYLKQNPWAKNNNWGNNHCLTLVQLQDNSFFSEANAKIKSIYFKHIDEKPENINTALLHPLTKWHLYDRFENGKPVGGKIDQIKLFFVLAFCILLIACVNFMNLSTARSEKRSKEVGVRKAIGSSRTMLISQFMLESLLLAFMGMAVAFILIEISLPYFNNLFGLQLVINYGEWKFWATLIGLILGTGLIAGSYPAFYLSSFEPVKVLKGFNIAGNSSLSVRKILVVFQFTFAACLIICTIVIYQQLNYIKNKPIGFNRTGLIEIPVQGTLKERSKFENLKERLISAGAATSVSTFGTSLNDEGGNTFGVSWPGKNPNEKVLFNNRAVGLDFIETVGSQLLAGRVFKPNQDSLSIMVNEAAVKAMKLANPLGTIINWGGMRLTITGIMKDFVMESPYQHVKPMLMYYRPNEANQIIIRLNPDLSIGNSVARVDKIVKNINPDFPVDRHFVDEGFQLKFQNEKQLGTLANWFGGFAIFISCLGLLGLAFFIAEQRKREISIRKVLGANTTDILTLLNKDFIKLVGIANLIAFPLAYIIVNRWLSNYEFKVGISALPFLVAILLSLTIAILTVSIQSVKVAKSNPIDALKYE